MSTAKKVADLITSARLLVGLLIASLGRQRDVAKIPKGDRSCFPVRHAEYVQGCTVENPLAKDVLLT